MKLQINKFKRHENLTVSIPARISGGNELGKSTILEAIGFVLTGKDLSGNEFKQVYDNRVDIHDAIADVSYFDNYGNEYHRIVHPVFQTGRDGVESIKIKCSTVCKKNSIPCNDFADEFKDFQKFGTDYFFAPKKDLEIVQRSIFIDILKSKLPDYDVNSASLKLKELKKAQKIEVDLVKGLQDANKNTKDVPVPEFPKDILAMNAEYIALSASTNSDAIAEINKKNNEAMGDYYTEKGKISTAISDTEIKIGRLKSSIETEKELLESVKKSVFAPKVIEPTERLESDVDVLKSALEKSEYFESVEKYAEKYFGNNPVLVENAAKIKEISERVFIPSGEISSNCPLNNENCPAAKLHSETAEKIKFEAMNNAIIATSRTQNRTILEKEMSAINSEYSAVKSDLQEAERKLSRVIESNKLVDDENETRLRIKKKRDAELIEIYNLNISQFESELHTITKELWKKQTELANLIDPTPEKLPESVEISEEFKDAHAAYELLKIDINKAVGVNENNIKLIVERSSEIKEKQANLLEIIEKITILTTEISDYFSNLATIVKQEFAGGIALDVELLEYVMSRDEYKDCFKITANGKVFPYECNGALQNNVKMQVLFNLQRLKGYTGVTVMDNCEANTTQPINTLGLNCILAFATNDNELTIK